MDGKVLWNPFLAKAPIVQNLVFMIAIYQYIRTWTVQKLKMMEKLSYTNWHRISSLKLEDLHYLYCCFVGFKQIFEICFSKSCLLAYKQIYQYVHTINEVCILETKKVI